MATTRALRKDVPHSHSNGVNPDDPITLAAAGRVLLDKKNDPREALRLFRRAATLDPKSAEIESYYGLCLARAERRFDEGTRLCENAVGRESFNAQLYCNLGRVYLLSGRRGDAYEALARGLSIEPNHGLIVATIARMGRRSSPVIKFLSRDHQINRVLGRWRHRLNRASA